MKIDIASMKLLIDIIRFAGLGALALAGASGLAQSLPEAPAGLSPRVARAQQALPMAAVRDVGGYVGRRIQAGTDGYVRPFDIDRFARMVEEKKTRDWWWIGEQPGKWLESAIRASQTADDQALREKARGILQRLVAAQEPGGYLGITDPAVRTPAQPLRGMDPYELYFLLHGLLTAAEEWKDEKALAAARRLGDYFVEHIGPGKAEFWPSPVRPPQNLNTIICPQFTWVPEGTPKAPQLYGQSAIAGHTAHYGWEGTLLIDPMLRLHQATGDAKYLEWSRWVIGNIDRWSGWDAFSRLDQVADGTLGVHQLQPYVHSHTFHMNFLGFLRMYEITGDAAYFRKVQGAWDDIARRQLYITGGVSVGEHYEPGYKRPLTGAVVETCANMSWMELTQMLLEQTGEPRYADAIEKLLLNHVFAAQTVDGDCYRYHTPPNGFKPDGYFHGPDCCTGSGHRIVAMLPKFIAATGRDAVFINQFVPSQIRAPVAGGEVALRLDTRYPETQDVLIRVDSASAKAPFSVRVRIPGWCRQPSVQVNAQEFPEVKPGAYASIRRVWKTGDTITLRLPMETRWVRHDHFENDNAPWALTRGPVVYALDTIWWPQSSQPISGAVWKEAGLLRLEASPRETKATMGALGPFFEVPVKLRSGQKALATFVPFSNVGRWYREATAPPDRRGNAFSYAVWLCDSDSPARTKP